MRKLATMISIAALATMPAAALSLVVATPVSAHDVLVSTSPTDGGTVDEPIDAVELTFNNPVSNEFAQVTVLDGNQTSYQQGPPEVVGPTVTQPVGALPDGTYDVSFRIVSSDGHPVSGTFTFTVTGAGGGGQSSPQADTDAPPAADDAATPAAAATTNDDGGLSGMTAIGLVAGGLVIIAGVGYFATGGRKRGADASETP